MREEQLQRQQQQLQHAREDVITVKDSVWEKLRDDLLTAVPELNEIGGQSLRNVYAAGVSDGRVLRSLAALSLPKSGEAQTNYDHHILTLARALAAASVKPTAKLAIVKTIMTLRSPREAGWQLLEGVIADTLQFITDRDYLWEYLDHSDEVLLWELRAICLSRHQQHRSDEILDRVVDTGNAAATFLSRQALVVEKGFAISTDVLSAGIEASGERLKQVIEPDDRSLFEPNSRAKVISLTYTDAAKRATDSVRITSRQAMTKVQNSSTKGIQNIAERGPRLIPNSKSRKVVCAAGRFGTAAVGATALVADALLESTGQVAKKTAEVTADVVRHKYGSSAGQVVRNCSDTVGNCLRTCGHVALLHTGKGMTRTVARKTGKMHVKSYVDEELEGDAPSSDGSLFDEAEGEMHDITATQDEASPWQHFAEEPTSRLDDSETTNETDSYERVGGDIMLVEGNNILEFDTTLTLSPSVLDSLPDQITSVDAQSDFFSDITNEPLYERAFPDLSIIHKGSTTHSSIFRNVDNESTGGELTPIKCLSDDEGTDYTACTVDETYVTNISLDTSKSMDHTEDVVYSVYDHDVVAAKPVGSPIRRSLASRVPPNGGYVPSSYEETKKCSWRKGIYSSVKSNFGL
ncbi:expressed unknown protein [Seminavis robusta]|uniref:Senescence domain-containing protein n=1 Tax=Seminavis robusta TaxID=568900 RepID=A0A9N8EE96_9STRA|nr:expressed unknown protein [Seminavis robusta]|eukprot:Sro1053_g235840.1 n/a (635) ;mRNA; r:10868-12772